MSGPTLVIELAESIFPAAMREFRALMAGLSSHFDEKRPGFFDVNVPAERLGVEDRREKDWRKSLRLPRLGNAIADAELTALVGFNPQREDWRRPFLVYLMGPGIGDESTFEAEHADEPEVEATLGFRPTHAVNVSACCRRREDRAKDPGLFVESTCEECGDSVTRDRPVRWCSAAGRRFARNRRRRCERCGTQLIPTRRGRLLHWCSACCRRAAYEDRQRAGMARTDSS